MGSFEINYDEQTLRMFTKEERESLRKLHERFDAKNEEIADYIANAQGYDRGDPRASAEAADAIDRWDVEMAARPIDPVVPLQHLLRERHEISDSIRDICDAAAARTSDEDE